MTQPPTFMGAFNQPRDVGGNERIEVARSDDSQAWLKCCKWIVGHLGVGCRDARQEGRFSDVWVAHETGICDQLEFQFKVFRIARLSWAAFAREPGWSGSQIACSRGRLVRL